MSTPLAIVTGTSRGLGTAVAVELLARGWRVLGTSRGEAPGELAAQAGYTHERCDLGDAARVREVFDGVFAGELAGGATRVALINNAAQLDVKHTGEQDLGELIQTLTVNAAVPTWLMGWALRNTPKATPLTLINVSSGAAHGPYPGWSSYCQTKAALLMAGQVLEQELAEVPALQDRPVAVVSYAPGVVATEMQAQIRASSVESFPRRARFEDLHRDGDLVEASRPAREMADLAERDDLPSHSVLRFGG
ncbi:MAG: SDR family NAD(P)-dependent oxidoreductase [Planctomycetota bacterium]|jgi:NAD(P)-dependent dehydrogenase (short-subunit alcohol dehydrogenase family)